MKILPPVLWAHIPAISSRLTARHKALTPPLLIISLPRSGSSWVGQILGLSDTSLYLREPITQEYLRSQPPGALSFFEFTSEEDPYIYQTFGDQAFNGTPSFDASVVVFPAQWRPSRRKCRRVVIKEVNPLVLKWYAERYRPRVIYLIRHPAAVANSFEKMGWTSVSLRERMSERANESFPGDASFWVQHAALQAITLERSLDIPLVL